jgi:hypothetical protein
VISLHGRAGLLIIQVLISSGSRYKEKKCRGYQSMKRKKPSEKLWDTKYERYKTSESGDGDMKPMNAEVILLAGWQ